MVRQKSHHLTCITSFFQTSQAILLAFFHGRQYDFVPSNLGSALRAAITDALDGEWTPPKASTAKIRKFKRIFGGLSAIHRHPNQDYGWRPLAVV